MHHSSVLNNTAELGGGFYSAADKAQLSNTTVSGNRARQSGGGVFLGGYRDSYRFDVSNSTIAFNQAEAGVGGNIHNEVGRMRLTGSIVSDAGSGENCQGEMTSLGHNLDSDRSCEMDTVTDLMGVSPLLAVLADNGGPTLTHALSADSPAVNRLVVDICPDVDQRFHYRKAENGNCDIGAFETGSERADSGTLTFSAARYSAAESDGTATLLVQRLGGSQGQVSVAYSDLLIGSAAARYDYEEVNADILYWADGDATDRSVEIVLRDDNAQEGLESAVFALFAQTGGATLNALSRTELVVIDDETQYGNFSFSSRTYEVTEDDGFVTVSVERLNGSYGAVSVGYETSDGGAEADADYTPVQGRLTFADGETAASFNVPILPDDIQEADEDIVITLVEPSEAVALGSISSAKIIIAGNDNAVEGGDTSGG
ncbi:MAG TPA: hypothetical protein DD979_09745, partial [Gammaproteobacteria bacterium]|nr:hypothetical protein [Gammaproteobacteria bacterium]